MDSTTSVSKGCFVFKNGATRAKMSKKAGTSKRLQDATDAPTMLGKDITSQPFYSVYSEIWRQLEADIEGLQRENYTRTLEDLVTFVDSTSSADDSHNTFGMEDILSTAALLIGINQTDHLAQFATLAEYIYEKISASVCVLQSRDCVTLKAAMETMVYNFIEPPPLDDVEDRDHKRLRRSQCTMTQLQTWYRKNFNAENDGDDTTICTLERRRRHKLVVILPDFECFGTSVLQDLILILSSYCVQLPFVLILGVATTVSALHNSLPYHVTSKIKVRVFQTQSATEALNEILERVILSPKYAFHLSGKAFKFLTHIFLYYDFSIHGFIQSFKYCLMEHYFQGNAYALCTVYSSSLGKISQLSHNDLETIRRLPSFRPYVEGINDCQRVIAILTDDDYLKKKLPQLLGDCQRHFIVLRVLLAFVNELVRDLPKCLLGKQCRELYATCLSKELTAQPEFKECWQMLSLLSKSEFVTKIDQAVQVAVNFLVVELKGLELATDCAMVINEKMLRVKQLLADVQMAGTHVTTATAHKVNSTDEQLRQVATRRDLKECLLQLSKQEKKPATDFGRCVAALLSYVERQIVHWHLAPLQRAPPLHELFVFSDIATVRRNIIGAPRAALHMALNNPHFYLQCKCCTLDDKLHQQLLPTLPDLSVVYKLHLECGRMINLYDWLQAFRTVVEEATEDGEGAIGQQQEHVDPQIQARFTRAVAELQFLGYIKMSKRKTDHATRLTW